MVGRGFGEAGVIRDGIPVNGNWAVFGVWRLKSGGFWLIGVEIGRVMV